MEKRLLGWSKSEIHERKALDFVYLRNWVQKEHISKTIWPTKFIFWIVEWINKLEKKIGESYNLYEINRKEVTNSQIKP